MGSGKTDIAYEYLKNKIVTWEIPPMSDISEEQLQKELGISRTPIREAILRLEKDGFVYLYPRKGTIVAEVSRDLVEEIYQVRRLLEPFIAEEASHSVSKSWLEDLRERLTNPPENMTDRELRVYYINLDLELHSTLLANCKNRFLQNEMRNVYNHNQRIRWKASNPRSGYDNSVQEHIEIIDALLCGDPDAIREATIHHITESKKITYGAM